MKTSFKHFLCISLAVVLLIAGFGCKKATTSPTVINDHWYQDSIDSVHRVDSIYLATRFDFRDSLVGRYAVIDYYDTIRTPYTYTGVVGPDTVTVYKAASDTNKLEILGQPYTFTGTGNNLYNFTDYQSCKYFKAQVSRDSIYCVTDMNCSGFSYGFMKYFSGHKIH